MTPGSLAVLSLRIAALVAVAWGITRARRRSSAAERHFVWLLAITGTLALPFATLLVPQLGVLPVPARAAVSAAAPVPATEQALPAPPQVLPAGQSVRAPAMSATISGTPAARVPGNWPWANMLLLVWGAGALLSLARLASAHRRAARLVAGGREAQRVACGRRSVVVRHSVDVASPFAYGVLRPAIVLPEEAALWDPAARDATVRHESAHIARHDALSLLVSQVATAVYWWHPAVRFAARQAAVECECACDDAVLRGGERASDYGAHLLEQARRLTNPAAPVLAAIMFGRAEGLATRITALLDPRVDRRPVSRRRALFAGVLGAAVLVLCAAAAPRRPSTAGAPAPAAASAIGITGPAPRIAPAAPPSVASTAGMAPSAAVLSGVPARRGSAEVCQQADPRRARTAHPSPGISITGAGGVTDDDGTETIIWTGADCIAWIRYREPLTIVPPWDSVGLGSSASFLAHDEGPAGAREFTLVGARPGTLTLNQQPVEITARDRTWLAGMVVEFVRRTGTDAPARARAFATRGGIRALEEEVHAITDARVRAVYLQAGFALTGASERAAFIHRNASLLDSASARATFLLAVPAAWRSSEDVLAAVYDEAALIEPDEYVEQIVRLMPAPRPVATALRNPLSRLIGTLQSIDRRTALRAYYLDERP
jgi:beta-lactamase regulating signal transducer with metallopeptidase domain